MPTVAAIAANKFIEGSALGSVNPSLWRQARLNNIAGLFEVTDGIYQLLNLEPYLTWQPWQSESTF